MGTHQGLYDIAWARCFPGVVIAAPKDGPELASLVRWAHDLRTDDKAKRPAATMIRYPKEVVPDCAWPEATPAIELGKAEVIQRGSSKLMVWAYGTMVARASQALQELGEDGEGVTLVNARFAKPFDIQLLKELAAEHSHVITIEDHALHGGFGSVVAEEAMDADLSLRRTPPRCTR